MWKFSLIKRTGPRQTRKGRRITEDSSGAVAVEFAIILPIITALILGLFDFGMGYFAKIELASAVRAGVQYATQNPTDTDKIVEVVQLSSGLGTDITVSSREYCGCSTDGSEVSSSRCSGTEPAGCNWRNYAEVTGTYDFSPMFLSLGGLGNILPIPQLSDTITFTETVAFRTD